MAYALSRVRRTLAEFFTWWLDQLKSLLPERLKRLLVPDLAELLLEVQGSRLIVHRRDGVSVRELGAVILDEADPKTVKMALRPVLEGQPLDHMRVCLSLAADRALRRMIDLPAAAEENLREVVAFEMDRLTPFAADAVHYDVHVIDRDPESRRIRAELMVLPRATVDPRVEALRGFGLEPEAVALPRRGTGGMAWRVPLATNGTNGRKFVGRNATLLLVLAAALVVTGLWLAFQRERNALDVLDREVVAARKDAEEGRALQEEIARLSSEGSFIVDKKRDRPTNVEVISELTRVMPDDTWLYRARLLDQELQTFGYAPNASALIGIIENSPLFSNAQFRAPLTRDQRVEAEQFHIAFRVQRKQQP